MGTINNKYDSFVRTFWNFVNFRNNSFEISNYNTESDISFMQKFKKNVFPDWLISSSLNFGRKLAFWKGRRGRSSTVDQSKIDSIENLAIGAGIIGAVLTTMGVVILRKQE